MCPLNCYTWKKTDFVTMAGRAMEPLLPGKYVTHYQALVGILGRSLAASYILK